MRNLIYLIPGLGIIKALHELRHPSRPIYIGCQSNADVDERLA